MPNLGPRTDPALDKLGQRLAERGYSKIIARLAPSGLSYTTALAIRLLGNAYGEQELIDDVCSLAVAWFEDNEQMRIGERIAAKHIDAIIRHQLELVLFS